MATIKPVTDSKEADDTSEITSANSTSVTTAICVSDQKVNVPFPPAHHAMRPASGMTTGQHRPPFAFNPHNTSSTPQIVAGGHPSSVTSAICVSDQKVNVPFPLAHNAMRPASGMTTGQHRPPFALNPHNTSGTPQIVPGAHPSNSSTVTTAICLTDQKGNVPFPPAYHAMRPARGMTSGQHRPSFAFNPHNTSGTPQMVPGGHPSNSSSVTSAICVTDQKGNVPFPLEHHAMRPASGMTTGQHRPPFALNPYNTSGTPRIVPGGHPRNPSFVTSAFRESDQKGNLPSPLEHHAIRPASGMTTGQRRPPFAFNPHNTSGTPQIVAGGHPRPGSMAELEKPKHRQNHPVQSHEVRAASRKCNYENQEIFLRPMCLVSIDTDGKFRIETEVLEQIKRVNVPVVVIAIVGLYRTGKSYLMNRLAGVSEGFPLGNTTEPATKGIWAWCKKHPKRKHTVLLLLDTEGIGDPKKGDVKHDIKLITLAALMCNVLVYNIMTAVNQDAIEKLTYPLVNFKVDIKFNILYHTLFFII